MDTSRSDLIAELLVTAHRLNRLAATAAGSTTPSAVWHTLSVLNTDGEMRIGELAAAARVSQPSMTKVVHQLNADGLVRRIADTEDSRAWQIGITPAGSEALRQWRDTLGVALEPIFADLTPSDMETISNAVDILKAHTAVTRKDT